MDGGRCIATGGPEKLMNEFLLALFLPAIALFGALWLSFRFVLDELLSSMGLGLIEPAFSGAASNDAASCDRATVVPARPAAIRCLTAPNVFDSRYGHRQIWSESTGELRRLSA